MSFVYLVAIIATLLLVLNWARRARMTESPCQRCGGIGTTRPFRGTATQPDFYRVPLNLCLACTNAQESFIDHRSMLVTESRNRFGRHEMVASAREVWGDRAVDMLALLTVAREDIDKARRILEPRAFEEIRPWLEHQISIDRSHPVGELPTSSQESPSTSPAKTLGPRVKRITVQYDDESSDDFQASPSDSSYKFLKLSALGETHGIVPVTGRSLADFVRLVAYLGHQLPFVPTQSAATESTSPGPFVMHIEIAYQDGSKDTIEYFPEGPPIAGIRRSQAGLADRELGAFSHQAAVTFLNHTALAARRLPDPP